MKESQNFSVMHGLLGFHFIPTKSGAGVLPSGMSAFLAAFLISSSTGFGRFAA